MGNPIIDAIQQQVASGKKIVRVRPKCRNHPAGVYLEIENEGEGDNTEAYVEIATENLVDFMNIWKPACVFQHIVWEREGLPE